jgi:hypothetical protein
MRGSSEQVGVQLDVERPHDHGQDVVGADREDQVEELLLVQPGAELGPGPVRDGGVGDELVDGSHHGPFEGLEALDVGTGSDALDLLRRQAGVPGEDDVLPPLVLGPAHGGDAEDEQLSLPR